MEPKAIGQTDGWAGDHRRSHWGERLDGDPQLGTAVVRHGPRTRRERLALLGLVFVVVLYVVIPVAAMLAV
jgi:hypothetical protein